MKCGSPLTSYKSQYQYRFRVDVLGDKNVGKTSLIEKLVASSDVSAVSGSTTSGSWMIDKVEIIIDFRELDGVHAAPDDKMDAALLVFDLSNRRTFVKSLLFFEKLKMLPNPPSTFLIANKSDETGNRTVEEKEAADVAKAHGATYIEVSASNGFNVDLLREKLIKGLLADKLEKIKRLLKNGQ
uniref:Small GTP-binding protein n=1 Tax=Caldiarchaeum subterraneum TaxID=311458 RepID=E6N9M1_CALS0|nr:small GTP-binding protein [Candidatus Caldarchaeum subterraneum]